MIQWTFFVMESITPYGRILIVFYLILVVSLRNAYFLHMLLHEITIAIH